MANNFTGLHKLRPKWRRNVFARDNECSEKFLPIAGANDHEQFVQHCNPRSKIFLAVRFGSDLWSEPRVREIIGFGIFAHPDAHICSFDAEGVSIIFTVSPESAKCYETAIFGAKV